MAKSLHLANILSKEFGGIEMPEQPSCFNVPSRGLALMFTLMT